MIIKIPIVTVDAHLDEMLPDGVGSENVVCDGLLNTDDISYTITDGEFTAIYLRSCSDPDGGHRSIVTTMTAQEMFQLIAWSGLTQN